MTSLFALTYPYLSGYQHIGASLGSSVDYAGGFGTQPTNWSEKPLTAYGNSNLSLACNNQVTSSVAAQAALKTRKYSAKGTRSCPYNMNSLLNDDVSAIVRRRNERERERVRCVNNHYEHLKRHLPVEHFNREKRISKLEVLRTAIKYIRQLQNVLEHSNNNNHNVDSTKNPNLHPPSPSTSASAPPSTSTSTSTSAKTFNNDKASSVILLNPEDNCKKPVKLESTL